MITVKTAPSESSQSSSDERSAGRQFPTGISISKRSLAIGGVVLVVGVVAATWAIFKTVREANQRLEHERQVANRRIQDEQWEAEQRLQEERWQAEDRIQNERLKAEQRRLEEAEQRRVANEQLEALLLLDAKGARRKKTTFEQPLPALVATSQIPADIDGCFLLADDEQYLGTISSNGRESILNKFGDYGSRYSDTSIFNEFGKYGGLFGRYSPFNEVTLTPPRVFTPNRRFVAYLTRNIAMTPRIDPHVFVPRSMRP